jgi:hypothetical protein
MGSFDIQQVCLNGHQITPFYNASPELRKEFCDRCGEKTIYKCLSCDQPIRGNHNVTVGLFFSEIPVPTNCDKCGKPFPWTERNKESIQSSLNNTENDALLLVEKLCSKFHLISKQLKSRYKNRSTLIINDEYDVQDLLHSLLYIFFDDIRKEEWTPSYAGSSSRIDFLLKNESMIIEVKKTRETLKTKQIGDELLIDIQRYQINPEYKTLVCFVYDPDGWIPNPIGVENDLNKASEKIKIKTIIVQKGN